MDIRARNDFSASVEQVWAMLTDPTFLTAVCQASGPVEFAVEVDGRRTRTRRIMTAPSQLASMTGPTIAVIDQITWESGDTATRQGVALITVEGLPAQLRGHVTLTEGGRGAVLSYSGTLQVDVPLVGPMLAKKAAPLLLEALEVQQQVGDEYLATHR